MFKTSTPGNTTAYASQVRAEQIDLLYGQAPVTLLTSVLVAFCLGIVHWDFLDPAFFPWFGLLMLTAVVRSALTYVYKQRRSQRKAVEKWVLPYEIGAGVNGILWGVGTLIMFSPAHPEELSVLLVTVAWIIAGGAVALSSIREAPACFIVPIAVCMAGRLFAEGSQAYLWLGIATLTYMLFMLRLALRAYRTTYTSLLLRHQNEDLLRDLERAKANTDQLNEELAEARDDALQALDAKSTFLATMSHEIRTPMNGVLGMAQLLLLESLNSRQRELATSLHRSGESLLSIINDILDFSRVEGGHVELESIPFELRDLVEGVGELLAATAHTKGIELALVIPAELPRRFIGDPGRLRQILINLIGNAIKFTERGEVELRVSAAPISRTRTMLRIAIRDTGIGVAPESRGHIFEAFSQADRATTRRFGGTGLGLAITRELVVLMGGEIDFDSVPGRGSTFWFTVPLEFDDAQAGATQPSSSTFGNTGVLVASANPGTRDALAAQFAAIGAPCLSLASGREALVRADIGEVHGEPLRFVILDRLLDDMSGLELAHKLAANSHGGRATVMLSMAGDEAMLAPAWTAAGVTSYLTKPVAQAALANCLIASAENPQSPLLEKPQAEASVAPTTAVRGHALLAEDHLLNQEMTVRVLQMIGLDVDVADDGRRAVDAFAHKDYDVILMDCQMPTLDGFAATAEIRQIERARAHGRRTPIIALTANAMIGDRERCIAAGMDDYISKPISIARLRDMVAAWLDARAKEGTTAAQSDAGCAV